MSENLRPVRLAANQPRQFYRGGAAIADLRGLPATAEFGPEDWVGSITTQFGKDAGLSPLPDGTLLRDAVAADPTGWLGAAHAAKFGADTALLVKLLDAGQRLPVHYHPSDAFASDHLSCRHGKTEAWIVVGTSGHNPTVHIGFKADADAAVVDNWVTVQDRAAMLDALNAIPVKAGDTVFIPAGLPHAIGEGVFIVELQQPTDFSITIEWQGFLDGPDSWHLGLGQTVALEALDLSGWSNRLDTIVKHTADDHSSVVDLLPNSDFFRAQRLHADSPIELDPSFAVLVVLDGEGRLHSESGDPVALRRGDTFVLPHAAGSSKLDGGLVAVRCLPPEVRP
ncbi:MAG TPA: class I mannose-6-phosphate isomerase [Kutzneria sp.]